VYRTGRLAFPALRGLDVDIHEGEMVSVVGPSGSGKSTLLNIITGIDRPSAGEVTADGQRIDTMSEEALAGWRGRRVGIVFQFFQLLPTLTALENAVLPMDFAHVLKGRARRERGRHNLELVGLGDKLDHLPSELSGGEQQRVAIARALACDPALLVCDEPTGNLDPDTSVGIMQLLYRINRTGTTILMVTHDREMVDKMRKRVIALEHGKLVRDERRGGYAEV
jgi:putative ABC transport system ATP-binding protein